MINNFLTTPISKIINENTFNGIFLEKQPEEFEISSTDFQNAINDVKQRLKVKLINGKCSSVLIHQLARHSLHCYEKFGNEIHQYHFQSILDVIECVENGRKAKIEPFKNEILAGLQHIHHNSNTFIPQNMINCWKEKCRAHFNKRKIIEKDEIEFQNILLKEINIEHIDKLSENIAQNKALTSLLTKILFESQFRSIEKQTGEWIVFGQKNNVNYYLCLATHKESKDFTDQVIFERIRPCFDEFPELR